MNAKDMDFPEKEHTKNPPAEWSGRVLIHENCAPENDLKLSKTKTCTYEKNARRFVMY